MARAKQTNRADARRRYRQATAQPADGDVEGSADDASDATGRTRANGTRGDSAQANAAARPGLLGAFRGAYRPPNYREDLAALPTLVRGRWFLIGLGLLVLGFVAVIVYPSSVTLFAYQNLTQAPAVLTLFLVGFTAARGSYLLGLVLGLIDIPLSVLGLGRLYLIAGQTFDPVAATVYAIVPGLPVAMLLAAAAAWYHRFLTLSSPRRQQAGQKARARSSSRKSTSRR